MSNETTKSTEEARGNRLADETSPYLLQHAANPVDWHPWGVEALDLARSLDRPILLSIGYAACHWCHVMERESFEDPEIAALMNRHFVCIKVDREERPDLDEVYMRAVQMMTGHGGWPLTAFLTPDLEPFYGGTYFPPEPRHGMPGFPQLLAGVAQAYSERRDEVVATAAQLREHLQPRDETAPSPLSAKLLYRAAMTLHERFDPNYGGFGPAPKFPNTTQTLLVLRYAVGQQDAELADEALFTLRQMAAGGIHDHAGGGFHRYSTDARWLVPHFEKMLYDNALLALAYLEAFQYSGDPGLAAAASGALDWVRRDMQGAVGGYFSTLDADSEGVEGKFYVWSAAEIDSLLGSDAAFFRAAYDVTEDGNWEHANILNTPRPLDAVAADFGLDGAAGRQLAGRCLTTLREARERRAHPALDDKVLSDWNGLMIAAMARGARTLGEPAYLESAQRAAGFIFNHMFEDGRLLHTYRNGEAKLGAYLDGYANMLWAALELFETNFELEWLLRARQLADALLARFWDEQRGGFHFTADDHEQLIARPRSGHDGATPSGNGIAASALLRLARWTGEERYATHARETLAAFAADIQRAPAGYCQLLLALEADLRDDEELVVVGRPSNEGTTAAQARLWQQFAPYRLVAVLDPRRTDLEVLGTAVPLLADKAAAATGTEPLFFACRNRTCAAPTTDLEEALEASQRTGD